MPRYRTIKPEFWTSAQIVECSPIARLLFVGLWNFADDGGVHPASAKQLKMEVFPGDSFTVDDIAGWVTELREAGLVAQFSAENLIWWGVTGWHHQKIDRPTCKYPPRGVDDGSTTARRPFAEGSPHKGIRIRVEGKGIEEEGNGIREGKGIEENKKGMSISSKAPKWTAEVDAVWEHYRTHRPRVRILGANTRSAIVGRLLEGFTVADLKRAIDGNYLSPHHCGQNDTGTEYHNLELIVRTAEDVERFTAFSFAEAEGKPILNPRSQRTAAAAKSYLQKAEGPDG